MTACLPLLRLLADGRFHSGEVLGRRLGVTRAAIWKQLKGLDDLGLRVQSVRGRGYRLEHPIELLDSDVIRDSLSPATRSRIPRVDVFSQIDSTNTYLKKCAPLDAPSGAVCLAEWQTAGRGRRGRDWVSPFGENLYLSVLWRFASGPAAIAGLSLVVGVAVARALRGVTGADIGLKWPNDLLWQGRKLAGILIDLAGEAGGPSYAVIGIGINVRMSDRGAKTINQPWVDLFRVCGDTPSRNRLTALVLDELVDAITTFELQGLTPFVEAWREFDMVVGRSVQLYLPNEVVHGEARGIDANGAFIVQVGAELRRFSSGEISLRMTT
ncbi:MAG: bifunctional biotin--[acetyl-CoA-carboxylase] ligase/biotin operon repressor BirA [Thiohalobacteraceae bacterium]